MATIRLDDFGGVAPIYRPRKLPERHATVAVGCRFQGGDLHPLRTPTVVQNLPFSGTRLFKSPYSGEWLAWPSPWVVDVVRSPVPSDQHQRIYWTRNNPAAQSGDNYPRACSQATQVDITNDSSNVRRLGVVAPTTKPTLIESQVESTVQPVTMSQTSPVRVTTAVDHPFKEGQRVVVKFANPPADPLDNMAQLNGVEFVLGDVSARAFDLRGSDGANYSPFTSNVGVTIERVYRDDDLVTRAYVFTLVTNWGEEGPPSPPSDFTDVRYDSEVRVNCTFTDTAGYRGVNRIRVYRTATGSSSTEYFLVKESPVTGASPYTVSVIDDVEEIGLGEIIPSTDWRPAENGLTGLVQMPNGFLAAFKGNTLHFSEPYMPHAWPPKYQKTTLSDIVGIAIYGQTLVVATKGKPYIATGTDPLSMSLQELDIDAPCINKGSVCGVGSGVMFASPDGLAFVSSVEARIITLSTHSKLDWASAWNDHEAVFHDRRYIAFSPTAAKRSLSFELNGETLDVAQLSASSAATGRAPAVDPVTDELHFLRLSGIAYSQQAILDPAGGSYGEAEWVSKVFTMPMPVSFSCIQVFADSNAFPMQIAVAYAIPTSSDTPTPSLPNQQVIVTVPGPDPVRMPGGFLAREWQVRMVAYAPINHVILAETMDEIRDQ